jgi:hypothetical protein
MSEPICLLSRPEMTLVMTSNSRAVSDAGTERAMACSALVMSSSRARSNARTVAAKSTS